MCLVYSFKSWFTKMPLLNNELLNGLADNVVKQKNHQKPINKKSKNAKAPNVRRVCQCLLCRLVDFE